MRRARLQMSREDALGIIEGSPFVQVAWVEDDAPQLRALHAVLVDGEVVFHGATVGAKTGIVGRRVVVQAQEVLASIPSFFTDPERACPATTYYRSVQVRGVARALEDPARKAEALAALMRRFQPEGGYAPIDPEDPRYRRAIETVLVVAIASEEVTGKANLGQSKPAATKRALIEALWRRGEARDPEVIERMRGATAKDPAPPIFRGPAGYTLHGWTPPEAAAQIAGHLVDAYWNVGLSAKEIEVAHLASTAWVTARDPAGQVVASARAVSDDAKHAWIYDVWTAEEHRRRGVAQALLTLLLDHPRVRGARRAHLCTRDAQPLYRNLGFEEAQVCMHPHMHRLNSRRGFDPDPSPDTAPDPRA